MLQFFEAEGSTETARRELLSQREKEIMHAIANSYTLNDVASSLGLSRHTVATHVRHIYEKLNVSNRAELIVAAQKLGLAREL